METRTKQEIKIYRLILNPITGRTEEGVLVALAYSAQALMNYHNEELESTVYKEPAGAEARYENTEWTKCFKKGGPLEWYNRHENWGDNRHNQGITFEWVEESIVKNLISKGVYKFIEQ